MTADPLRLEALLESVADGSDVDWDAAEAAASDEQRPIVRNLRLVARIAEVHRTVAHRPVPNRAPDPVNTAAVGAGVSRWGHLLLLDIIGEGAFGEVYRARDPWLDREVALKLLKPDIAGPARLVAEAQAMARVRHPNVVTVYGADLRDDRVGLWMEFIRGRTLAAIVATEGPFSAAEAATIGQELCKAVAAVHAAGLVHRDIKAQNVMRESGGRLVLMDFGTGYTPLYAAPELALGGEPTVATDIYALGVLLYFLVTARYPVKGTSVDELRLAHANGVRERLHDAGPDRPDPFAAAVERALSPDPRRRFATPSEMHQALAAPMALRPEAPAIVHVAPRPRLRQKLAAMALAAGLVLAAFAGWFWTRATPPARTATDPLTLAVLPLAGDGGAGDYFADGITEALIQELSVVDSLRLISRTSIMQFKGSRQSARDIAAALNADVILEGAVTRSGNDVRINVRLIHAGSDRPVWSRGFDRSVDNVIVLQHDVAKAVAGDLPIVVTPSAAARWEVQQTVNPRSYDAYLRGRAALNERSRDGLSRALTLFAEALRLDSKNAQAHAGVAIARSHLAGLNGTTFGEEAERARAAAQAALALDPQNAEAHAVLAEMMFFADWDWTGAEAGYRRALAINASLDFARERYSMFLAARRRIDEALQQLDEARRLDPLSVPLIATHAGLLRYARRYPEAIERYREVLSKQPQNRAANVGIGRALIATGKFDEALAHHRRILDRDRNDPFVQGEMAQAHIGAGRRGEGLRLLRELEARGERAVDPEILAYVHARLGTHDEAFTWLNRAFDIRSPAVLWLAVDSRVDPLRDDERFRVLLRRLALE